MLWHGRQIWQRLSAGIRRQESNTEERPAVLSKTKPQDITVGKKDPRGQKDRDHCVWEWGAQRVELAFRPPGLLQWEKEEAQWKDRSHSLREHQCGEKNLNPNEDDECRAVCLPWIPNMGSGLSEGERRTQLRGHLWLFSQQKPEGLMPG